MAAWQDGDVPDHCEAHLEGQGIQHSRRPGGRSSGQGAVVERRPEREDFAASVHDD